MNNILSNLPESYGREKKRRGRGPGSNRGLKCGRGQQGMKQRNGGKPGIAYEGGQTPFYLKVPKVGMKKLGVRRIHRKDDIFAVKSENVRRVCDKYDLKEISGGDILKYFGTPFYLKRVKIIGDRDIIKNIILKGIIN